MWVTGRYRQLIAGQALILGLLVLAALPAFAQVPTEEASYVTETIPDPSGVPAGDFVVGPGKVEVELEPGQTVKSEVIITNRTGTEQEFRFEIEDIAGSRDTDRAVVLLGGERGPYTLKDYLLLPTRTITLAHNERARVPVTIAVPLDAEAGGHYGSVLVSIVSQATASDDGGGAAPRSAVISRIGTLFFVTVPGETDVAGSLVDFDTIGGERWYTASPIPFQLVYENTGSLHVNPYGEIRIHNLLGSEVGFVELEPWFALPQSLRAREVSWEAGWLLGRYTATAAINRGYDDIVDERSVTFWVVPLPFLVSVLVGLFVFFLIIRLVVNRFEIRRKDEVTPPPPPPETPTI